MNPQINWKEEAKRFTDEGVLVFPYAQHKSGGYSMPNSWGDLRDMTAQQVIDLPMWAEWQSKATGLAMIIPQGWEVIDVDSKNDPTDRIKEDYTQAVYGLGGDDLLNKCVWVATKSDGYHFVYRADNVEGSKKLAMDAHATDPKKKETLLETKGAGDLLFVAPTPGYDCLNKHYLSAPKLSNEERNILVQAGRTCNRVKDESEVREVRKALKVLPTGDGKKPWESFDEQHDVADMLEDLGWTRVGGSRGFERYNRPGHKNPRQPSGSVIVDKNVFYPFTTSTGFEDKKCYGPFGIYAVTIHNGDFSAAAKELYSEGYGDRLGPKSSQRLDGSPESIAAAVAEVVPAQQQTDVSGAEELRRLLEEVDSDHTFSINDKMEETDYIAWYVDPATGEETGLSAFGMFGLMVGLQKSGKTTVLRAFIIAALTKKTYLNFRFDLKGRKIILIDCEQPRYWFQMVCRGIYRAAGLKEDTPLFKGVNLRRYSKAQRAAIVAALFAREKNLGLGIIDGLVDICQNFNDVEKAEHTIDQVLNWSDTSGALVIGVIHLTKGMGFIKGHLGTIAQNKCDFAIECAKTEDNGRFNLSHREARGKEFESFDFYRDDNGDPITEEQKKDNDANWLGDDEAYNPSNSKSSKSPLLATISKCSLLIYDALKNDGASSKIIQDIDSANSESTAMNAIRAGIFRIEAIGNNALAATLASEIGMQIESSKNQPYTGIIEPSKMNDDQDVPF